MLIRVKLCDKCSESITKGSISTQSTRSPQDGGAIDRDELNLKPDALKSKNKVIEKMVEVERERRREQERDRKKRLKEERKAAARLKALQREDRFFRSKSRQAQRNATFPQHALFTIDQIADPTDVDFSIDDYAIAWTLEIYDRDLESLDDAWVTEELESVGLTSELLPSEREAVVEALVSMGIEATSILGPIDRSHPTRDEYHSHVNKLSCVDSETYLWEDDDDEKEWWR